jgi:hypothetical protein
VTSGKAIVVCPIVDGRLRLVQSMSGKPKNRLFDAAQITWWIF